MLPTRDQPALQKLLLGDGLRCLNDQVVMFAAPTLALLALEMSASQSSLIAMAEWLPALVLSGVAGRLADRYDRRRVLAASGLLSALGLGLMCLAPIVSTSARFSLLLSSVVLYAAAGVIASLASGAFIPVLATRVSVPDALSMQASVRSFARILGQAIAGPMTQFLGAIPAISVAIAAALFGTAAVSSIKPQQLQVEAASRSRFSAWRSVVSHPVLRRMTLLAFTMNFGGAIISGAFFAYAYRTLGLTPVAVGTMLFAGGVSAVAAAHFTRTLTRQWQAKSLCAVSGLLASMSVWLIPAASLGGALPVLMLYEVIFSGSATVFVISFSIIRQSLVSNNCLGKLIAVSTTVAAASIVLGTLVSAILVSPLGLRVTIMCGCAISTMGVLSITAISRGSPDPGANKSEATLAGTGDTV